MMTIKYANPMQGDEITQRIRRLNNIATWFMKRRLFTLENICQKVIDYYINKHFLDQCKTCKYKENWWNMKTTGECRWCWYDRMYQEHWIKNLWANYEEVLKGWHP